MNRLIDWLASIIIDVLYIIVVERSHKLNGDGGGAARLTAISGVGPASFLVPSFTSNYDNQ